MEEASGHCVIITANGMVEASEESTVYINDLDTFVCVNLVEDVPVVLSFGMLCENDGLLQLWQP